MRAEALIVPERIVGEPFLEGTQQLDIWQNCPGFAEKAGKDMWIQFTDLPQAELFYWDNQQDQWAEFKL